MARTVIALYDNFSSANDAIRDLVNSGFNRSDVSIMARDESGEYSRYLEHSGTATEMPDSGASTGAGVGAGIGAAIGGLAGILVGLGALAIPGIGPVLAAGPLAAAIGGLAGAGTGAVAGGITGGLIGALSDMGVPEENAGYFAEGVRRGGTLVVARVTEEMAGTARDVLNRHDPVDMNERVSQWRQSGWTGYEGSTMGTDTHRQDEYAHSDTTAAYQEAALADTGDTSGEWNRSGYSESSDPTGSSTYGTNQPHSTFGDSPREKERGMDTGRESDYETDTGMSGRGYDESSRSTPYSTGQSTGSSTTPYSYPDYTTHQDGFRNHFTNSMYANSYTYEQYEPAYRYGYDLATNSRYQDRQWEDIETEARGYWDERNPGTWDRIKDAVRHAWYEVRSALD